MRKILLAGTALGLLASSALAGDLSVTVTGRNFTEAGGVFGVTDAYKNVSVGSTFNPLNVTPNQKTYGIGNAARIGVRTQIEADNGMKYGAVASLVTTAIFTQEITELTFLQKVTSVDLKLVLTFL